MREHGQGIAREYNYDYEWDCRSPWSGSQMHA